MVRSATFPFIQYRYPDGSSRHATEIPVRITNPDNGKHVDCYALIDTGADGNLFTRKLAEDLLHDFQGDGVLSSVNSGIGGSSDVYKHTFSVGLYGQDLKNIVWESKPALTDCIDADIPLLLGVAGFLEFFELNVDYPNKTITLQWQD